ncbi:unnamed protein product, partial [Ectocarpus sp. 12 AP-2014]
SRLLFRTPCTTQGSRNRQRERGKGGRRSSGPVDRLQAESVRQVAISMPQNQHCSSSNRGIVSPLEAHAYACDRMIKVGGDFSSLQNIPGGHHNHPCCQHQHL